MARETVDGVDYPSSDMTKEPPSEIKQEGDASGRGSPYGAHDRPVYLRGIPFWMVSMAYVFLTHWQSSAARQA